ncbi:MAG: MarR family winged helix-turn-helix transcriptional regulator [Clostridiaceae bacterium]
MNLGYGINLCSKLLKNKLNKELEEEGLTAAQFAVIKDIEINSAINEDLNQVTAVAIAQRLDMDKPTISGIVNRLITKGYIEKVQHPKDKRAFILRITELCDKKMRVLEEINKKVIQVSLTGISEDELKVFHKVLSKIIKNMK